MKKVLLSIAALSQAVGIGVSAGVASPAVTYQSGYSSEEKKGYVWNEAAVYGMSVVHILERGLLPLDVEVKGSFFAFEDLGFANASARLVFPVSYREAILVGPSIGKALWISDDMKVASDFSLPAFWDKQEHIEPRVAIGTAIGYQVSWPDGKKFQINIDQSMGSFYISASSC
ncbi:hypothetical protein [Candidatus Synchoanobacter obligatus]|uniref:Outer membrane protein beta-barrel domain-containing protein n=1 Tax=Candidatus Synchoanobacter obligatus TaxID=2919597 RepID=A0ABT1L607_9GAMM|nr:hypothetical protein [Candidatus Synchoanobacter obligatus]MCP8352577.1 hypothetical protein [Candidatus Synchoanobacter obligatus]